MIHFAYEGSWVYLSAFCRTVNWSEGPLAEMRTTLTFQLRGNKRETRCSFANREKIHKGWFRWGTVDPTGVVLG
jgi:hypothetical protein